MLKNSCPILCFLTDKNGNILSPYEPGAIRYTELIGGSNDRPRHQVQLPMGKTALRSIVAVMAEGYVAYSSDWNNLSAPVPFCMIQYIFMCVPGCATLNFSTKMFDGSAVIYETEKEQVEIILQLETVVCSTAQVTLLAREINESGNMVGEVCIYANRVYDSKITSFATRFLCRNIMLRAQVYEYIAISDGKKRIYTNKDELKKYGNRGILSPDTVSYYNLFVNGVLQPAVSYTTKEGVLEFLTTDVPAQGEPVILMYVTIKSRCGWPLFAQTNYFIARSNGKRRVFTNADGLENYGCGYIPDPAKASMINLYVNGALQPRTNYKVKEGVLELTTSNLPPEKASVILESVLVQGPEEQLIKTKNCQYNASSEQQKIYTDSDQIRMYGTGGIPNPKMNSFQNLYVNGVIQPEVNYSVHPGILRLNTKDAPIERAPVTLQSVRAGILCGEKQRNKEDL